MGAQPFTYPHVWPPEKPMRTYTIELKIDFDDETKFTVVADHLKEQCRQTLAVCMMLAEKRPPQLAFHSQDFFHGNEDLEFIPDEDTL